MELPPRLLDTIAESRAKVCFGYPWWLRPFLMRDVIAITLGRRIYVREAMAIERLERLLRHELAHVRQVRQLGLIRFLWRYLREFGRHWWRLRDLTKAYSAISFEIEACAAEDL
jgi:hypothetical protein